MSDPSGCVCLPAEALIQKVLKLLEKMLSLLEENYRHNSEMDNDPETTTQNRIINDQNGITGKSFKYGKYMASWNACETIAVHNAFVLLGMDSCLSGVMLSFQLNGAMIGDGYFGSNPYSIGRVLADYKVPYSSVALSEMTQTGVYIVSFWNPKLPFEGLHTVAVYYDGTQYSAFNLHGDGAIYTFVPSEYRTRYICGYYLGG